MLKCIGLFIRFDSFTHTHVPLKMLSIANLISLNGENVRGVPHTKYLGVILDEHLTFNEHIKKTSFKAHQVKSFLQRNISSCPSKVKEACYWASTVWSPYTKVNTRSNTAKSREICNWGLWFNIQCYRNDTITWLDFSRITPKDFAAHHVVQDFA